MKSVPTLFLIVFSILLLSVFAALNIPLWWDEGWSLVVAKNWVTESNYSVQVAGEWRRATLAQGFTVVAPVALSFKLFGVGLGQARLPFVVFTVLTALLYFLALRRLHSKFVAIITIALIALISCFDELNPVFIGSQVLGEGVMLLCLSSGLLGLLLLSSRPLVAAPLCVLAWSLALYTKPQPLPFMAAATLCALVTAYRFQLKKEMRFLLLCFILSYLISRGLGAWQGTILEPPPASKEFSTLAFQVSVLNLSVDARLRALYNVIAGALPLLLAIPYALIGLIKRRSKGPATDKEWLDVVKIYWLFFGSSWFLWYLFLSVGWPRYLSVPIFLCAPLVSEMIANLVGRGGFREFLERAGRGVAVWKRVPKRNEVGAAVTVITGAAWLSFSSIMWFLPKHYSNQPFRDTVAYLNEHSSSADLIETYESELFFMLETPVHFPDDELHMKLNEKVFLNRLSRIDYNPEILSPTFMVVGKFGKLWGLYDQSIKSGRYKRLATFGVYDIYKRS